MPRYQVNVKAPAEDRTAFIKALRTVAGISLKRAADLSLHFDRFRNSTLVAGVGKATAEHIAETLIASGASVTVLESPLNTPMMCCPAADDRFKWSSPDSSEVALDHALRHSGVGRGKRARKSRKTVHVNHGGQPRPTSPHN